MCSLGLLVSLLDTNKSEAVLHQLAISHAHYILHSSSNFPGTLYLAVLRQFPSDTLQSYMQSYTNLTFR